VGKRGKAVSVRRKSVPRVVGEADKRAWIANKLFEMYGDSPLGRSAALYARSASIWDVAMNVTGVAADLMSKIRVLLQAMSPADQPEAAELIGIRLGEPSKAPSVDESAELKSAAEEIAIND